MNVKSPSQPERSSKDERSLNSFKEKRLDGIYVAWIQCASTCTATYALAN